MHTIVGFLTQLKRDTLEQYTALTVKPPHGKYRILPFSKVESSFAGGLELFQYTHLIKKMVGHFHLFSIMIKGKKDGMIQLMDG